MARRVRVEFGGALYHVISRGNYRIPIFHDDGVKRAFIDCVFEACRRAGWVLSAFVIMRNHYHLALQTPEGNLSAGMHWLQSTFATRFNRFRRESGHVFQGRFKAIVVEAERDLANVAHYIHLNPVRAGIVSTDQLDLYPYSSYVYFRKEGRASCLNPTACLAGAGELKDNSADWELYHKYLSWLAESDEERKRLQFDDLSKGWAIGSPEFRREAARIINEATSAISTGCRTRTEAKEIGWEVLLERALVQLGRNTHDVAVDKKSADWKVAIAAHLKAHTTAKNPWLAHQLNMGDPDGVSRYVSECHSGKRKQAKMLLAKITDIRV